MGSPGVGTNWGRALGLELVFAGATLLLSGVELSPPEVELGPEHPAVKSSQTEARQSVKSQRLVLLGRVNIVSLSGEIGGVENDRRLNVLEIVEFKAGFCN